VQDAKRNSLENTQPTAMERNRAVRQKRGILIGQQARTLRKELMPRPGNIVRNPNQKILGGKGTSAAQKKKERMGGREKGEISKVAGGQTALLQLTKKAQRGDEFGGRGLAERDRLKKGEKEKPAARRSSTKKKRRRRKKGTPRGKYAWQGVHKRRPRNLWSKQDRPWKKKMGQQALRHWGKRKREKKFQVYQKTGV